MKSHKLFAVPSNNVSIMKYVLTNIDGTVNIILTTTTNQLIQTLYSEINFILTVINLQYTMNTIFFYNYFNLGIIDIY